MNKIASFTMAEVLITLGIIGIVAAMTMSTIIANTQKKEFSSRLKRFYSLMTQAITLSENVNGPIAQWDKPKAERTEEGTLIDTPDNSLSYFKYYLSPFIKTLEIGKRKMRKTDSTDTAYVAFIDGSSIYMINGDCLDIIFDANGNKNPNEEGKDRFRFLLCTSKYNEYFIGKNKYFGTYTQENLFNRGREYMLQSCKTSPHYCATLLMHDNWEFKKDYPW